MSFLIYPMAAKHIPAMVVVESSSHENYWKEGTFVTHLRTSGCDGIVAFNTAGLVGFLAYEWKPDVAYLQIWNLVVDAKFRRRKVASALVGRLIEDYPNNSGIICNVRESNLAAQLFLRQMNFWCDAIARGYFIDKPNKTVRIYEDAYCFDNNQLIERNKNAPIRITNRLGHVIARPRSGERRVAC